VSIGINLVRYFRTENRGAPAARNYGLVQARGEFVKFLDDDDQLLSGVLEREIARARNTGADVVISGWINRTYSDKNRTDIVDEQVLGPPPMQRGVDDMLDSHAPWTAAALYRLSAVKSLRWDETCGKAQEWMWAWTVCLSGARYTSIDEPSSIYVHYPSAARLTHQGNAMLRSTHWRLYILRRVEIELAEQNLLTPDRRRKLIQYYYKDSRTLCEMDPQAWSALCERCRQLDPQFMPHDGQLLARFLNRVLGYYHGVRWFVGLRAGVRRLQAFF
jgi:glycosyltransferase involved in cell wall biosynthesis